MKKLLMLSFVLTFLFSSNVLSQEKNDKKNKRLPPPASTVKRQALIDSLLSEQDKQKYLPSLKPKEYTIIGQEQINRKKRDRKTGETKFRHLTGDEKNILNKEIEEKEVHFSGTKKQRQFEQNMIQRSNEVYGAFGRYDEINAGFIYGTLLDKDELYFDFDFQRSGGHIDDAGYTYGDFRIHDSHQFSNSFIGNFDLNYKTSAYRFYSGSMAGQERKRHFVSLRAGSRVATWSKFDIDAAVEGRYGTLLDMNDLKEKGFTAELSSRGLIKNSSLKTNVLFDYHNLDNDVQSKSLNFFNANTKLNLTLGNSVMLKIGARFFSFSDYYFSNETRIYPDAELIFSLARHGEVYAEYKPGVKRTSLNEFLAYNRFLDANTEFAYEETDISLRTGWRKKVSESLLLELYYTYSHYKNIGIYVEPLWKYSNGGVWEIINGYKTEVHGIHASAGYQWGSRTHIMTALHAYDYGDIESVNNAQLPYRSQIEGEFMLEADLGYGFSFTSEATFLGKRYSDIFWKNKLDPVFLLDAGLKKKFKNTFQIEIKALNIFNSDYECWKGYMEPDLRALGGLRFYF